EELIERVLSARLSGRGRDGCRLHIVRIRPRAERRSVRSGVVTTEADELPRRTADPVAYGDTARALRIAFHEESEVRVARRDVDAKADRVGRRTPRCTQACTGEVERVRASVTWRSAGIGHDV